MPLTDTFPRLSYTLSGAGEPMLLIMGFGMRGIVWRRTSERLAHSFQVCIYDHRDIGDSDETDAPYAMSDLADDAVRLLDALGWERAHIVGVSMGGMVAQELGLMHPERVRSLSLIATQPGGPTAWIPPLRSLPLLAGIGLGSRRLNKVLFPRLLHPAHTMKGVSAADRRQREQDAHSKILSPAIRRRQLRAVRSHDTRARLRFLRAPTLVVKPVHDRLCRTKGSDRLVATLPNAKLVELDAGHGLIFHAADALSEAITSFVRSVPDTAPSPSSTDRQPSG